MKTNGKNFFVNHPIFLKYKTRFDFSKFRQAENLKSVHINERIIEIPFAIQAVGALRRGAKILDLGCTESALSLHLSCLGYEVTGFDFREYPYQHPNLRFVHGDMTKLPFENETFDAILSISTLEHVGIGFYQDPEKAEDADQRAMEEIGRVLKSRGLFILSTPFGQARVSERGRVYDQPRLEKLCKDLTVEESRYFQSQDLPDLGINTWIEVSQREASLVASPVNTQAICLARCRKR